MKIAVLGATGRTGIPLLETLLERGHDVVVLARDPSKLGALAERVRVVQGSARDRDKLVELVAGADAVVSALNSTKADPTLFQDTARALVEIMGEAGVTRYVGVSGAGVDVPGDQKAFVHRVISKVIMALGGELVKDKPAEYLVWAASDIDWTLVRPPRLTDGAPTGRIEHHAHRSCKKPSIRRADLAVFVADVVEQHLYPRQAPLVAGA